MTINPLIINKLFSRCKLSRYCTDAELVVTGIGGEQYSFSKKKLFKHRVAILNTLKLLPEGMRRSNTDIGMPWVSAFTHDSNFYGCTQRTIERLIALGIAFDGISIVKCPHPDITDLEYIIVEDKRIMRNERTRIGSSSERLMYW